MSTTLAVRRRRLPRAEPGIVELPFDLLLSVLAATLVASLGAALLDEISLQLARQDATAAIEQLQSALLQLQAAGPLGGTVVRWEPGGNGLHQLSGVWLGCSETMPIDHPSCSGAYVAFDTGAPVYIPLHDAGGSSVAFTANGSLPIADDGPAKGTAILGSGALHLTLLRQLPLTDSSALLQVIVSVER